MSDANQHTPGPWLLNADAHKHEPGFYGTPHEVAAPEVYYSIHIGDVRITAFMKPADALLIITAPDLLALARQLASECAECGGRGFIHCEDGVIGRGPDDVTPTRYHCEDCYDIRSVIAKAEGREVMP